MDHFDRLSQPSLPTSAAATTSYRPDIDGLRALAVLGVVLYHADLGVSGGYVGVDVFFVISGYLITGIILKDLERGTFSLARFWERRIRRILPALFFVTVATLAFGWVSLIPENYEALGRSTVYLASMASNVFFWQDTGYFNASAEEKPLLHTWSLAVEEQFYLIFPSFVLLVTRARPKRRAVVVISTVAVASLLLSIYATSRHPAATFYLLPTRAWELLAGSLLAFGLLPAERWSSRANSVAAWSGIILVLVPFFLYGPETPFPGLAAIPPVLGSVLIIASGAATSEGSPVASILSWPPLVFVGLISYSLYLWHWPVLVFARLENISALSLIQRISLVLLSFAMGALSWHCIEQPFRSGKTTLKGSGVWLAGISAYAFLLCVGLAISLTRGVEWRLPAEVRRVINRTTTKYSDRYKNEHSISDIPRNLTSLGDSRHPPSLFVWGDSHAMSILPAIDVLGREVGASATAATHSSTPPMLDFFFRTTYGLNERSVAFNSAVLSHIKSSRIPTVVLAAKWGSYIEAPTFPDALLKTVRELTESHATVYFLIDIPTYDFNVPQALGLFLLQGWANSKLELDRESYRKSLRSYDCVLPRLREAGVHILDPTPLFEQRSRPGRITPWDLEGCFYRDGHHLNDYGSLILKPLLAPLFQEVTNSSRPAPG